MTFKNVDLCFIVEFKREINTQAPPCLGIWMAEVRVAKAAHFLCEETRLCACESVKTHSKCTTVPFTRSWFSFQHSRTKTPAWEISSQQLQM